MFILVTYFCFVGSRLFRLVCYIRLRFIVCGLMLPFGVLFYLLLRFRGIWVLVIWSFSLRVVFIFMVYWLFGCL